MNKENFKKIKNEVSKIIKVTLTQINKVSDNNKEMQKNAVNLKDEAEKLENSEFTIAIIGTMKAGKSTTINAIVGQEILPHRVEAMTTLPTTVTHKTGQTTPKLHIEKIDIIKKLIQDIANKLRNKELSELSDYLQGIAKKIKEKKLVLEKQVSGKEKIFDVLKTINDLMRLSKELGINPPYEKFKTVNDFPRIEVEFLYLQNKSAGVLKISCQSDKIQLQRIDNERRDRV